jgi:hypothetical protein
MLTGQELFAGPMGGWLVVIIVWSLIWKGLALWRAARTNSPVWFVVFLVVNTLGVLEISYYFFLADMGEKRLSGHHNQTHHTGKTKE